MRWPSWFWDRLEALTDHISSNGFLYRIVNEDLFVDLIQTDIPSVQNGNARFTDWINRFLSRKLLISNIMLPAISTSVHYVLSLDMSRVEFNCLSYAKMIFHALKYQHCALFGIIVGISDEEDGHLSRLDVTCAESNSAHIGRLICLDSIPVLHESASLNVVPEIALALVDAQCSSNSRNVVGVYFSNENFHDDSLDPFAVRIADKVLSIFPEAVLVQIDNTALRLDSFDPPMKVYGFQNKMWKPTRFHLENEEAVISSVLVAMQNKLFRELNDFENHLDNLSLDYWNSELNVKIEELQL